MNTQAQSTADQNHSTSDFEEAIKAMGDSPLRVPDEKDHDDLDPEEVLDAEEEQQPPKAPAPETEKKPVHPKIDLDPKKYDQALEAKRKQFLAEKKWKEEKLQYEQRIKELEAKANKPTRKEESRSEDEIFDDIVNDPENKWLSPQEIAKKVREEVMAEIKKERELENQKQSQEMEISIFKEKINEHIETNAEQYPMISAMGYEENVFDIIEQAYARDSEKYGDEYANDNIMSIEEASKKLENYLAQQFKTRVKSKKIGKSLSSYLSDDEETQSPSTQSNTPKTLSNDFSRNPSSKEELPEDERELFKLALSKVK